MERTRIQTPEDLLAYLPYLLGFHPDHCLIVLGLRSAARRAQVTFTLRMEIPPADATDSMLRGSASWLGETMERRQAASAVLVAYSPSARDTARFARMLLDELQVRRIRLREGIRADGKRWWPVTDERGSSDDGVPYDVSNHPLVTSAVYQGRVALPDEQAVRDSILPVGGLDGMRARWMTARVQGEFAEQHPEVPTWPAGAAEEAEPVVDAGARYAVGLVRRMLADRAATANDEEIAWLGMYVLHPLVRDEVWSLMEQATAERHVEVWRDIARRCDPELMVAPFALLGFAAWLSGDGILARHAVQTALTADPSYTMAKLVSELLTSATPPSRWTPHPMTRAHRTEGSTADNGRTGSGSAYGSL